MDGSSALRRKHRHFNRRHAAGGLAGQAGRERNDRTFGFGAMAFFNGGAVDHGVATSDR